MAPTLVHRINVVANGVATAFFGAQLLLFVLALFESRSDFSAEEVGRLCGDLLVVAIAAVLAAWLFKKLRVRTYRWSTVAATALAVFVLMDQSELSSNATAKAEAIDAFVSKMKELAADQNRRLLALDRQIEPPDVSNAGDMRKLDRQKLDAFAAALRTAESNAEAAPDQAARLFNELHDRTVAEIEARKALIGDFGDNFLTGMDKSINAGKPLLAANYKAQATLYHDLYDMATFLSANPDQYAIGEDGNLLFRDQAAVASWNALAIATAKATQDYESKNRALMAFEQAAAKDQGAMSNGN